MYNARSKSEFHGQVLCLPLELSKKPQIERPQLLSPFENPSFLAQMVVTFSTLLGSRAPYFFLQKCSSDFRIRNEFGF